MNRTRADQIFARFKRFHLANGNVWFHFQRFTRELILAGFEHYSAFAILHRIRWHVAIETKSEDGLKINNDFAAYYARMYAVKYPAWKGFFRFRFRTTTGEPAHETDFKSFVLGPANDEEELLAELEELGER